MLRNCRRAVAVTIVSLLVAGCGEVAPTAPARLQPDAVSPSGNSQLAAVVTALQTERAMLERLVAVPVERRDRILSARVSKLREFVDRLARDSASLSAANTSGMRASRSLVLTGVDGPGEVSGYYVDPYNSYTEFQFPLAELNVQTVPSWPANYLYSRTSGSYTKFGQTYGILSTKSIGDYTSTQLDTPPILTMLLIDVIPVQVDCTRFGVEASATSQHRAAFYIGEIGRTWSEASTSGADQGQCPHVAPTAHFRMTGGGAAGSDISPLEMTAPGDVIIDASGSERDAPIVSYAWTIALNQHQQGFSTGTYADYGSTGVSLTLTDALGKTAIADGVISVSDPAPPPPPPPPSPPPGGGGGGGGGGMSCTYWEISYDDGLTWHYLGTTCP